MSGKKKIIIIVSGIFILAIIISTSLYLMFKQGMFLPGYINWNNAQDSLNIENESIHYSLANRQLTIYDSKDHILYETQKDIFVSDVFFFDVDHDDALEVCMITWKQGSYGEHKPFWIKRDTMKFTQHIFIYDWDIERTDRLDPIWMSSDIGMKAIKFTIDNSNRIHITDYNEKETVWEWIHWGLTKVGIVRVTMSTFII